MRKWSIYKRSSGGVSVLYMSGFTTREEAEDVAAARGWYFIDKYGFVWDLYILESK